MDPTLSQLKYIVVVDRLKHFGKAAEECNVSQPSLSQQIHKVEELLNFTIFDRGKKPIQTTEEGKQFIQQAHLILKEHEKLLQIQKSAASEVQGELRLAMIPTLTPYLLPLFLSSFSKRYPKVKLMVDELKTEDIIAHLKSDQLDAGILATPLHEEGLKEDVLFYERFFLYAAKSHSILSKSQVSDSDIDAGDLWILKDGHCFRNQIFNFCSFESSHGVFENVMFEGGSLETLKMLIDRGRGYTLLPELFVLNHLNTQEQKRTRAFKPPVPAREVSLVYHRRQWKVKIMQAIQQSILQHLPEVISLKQNKSLQILDIK